jgi:hypothetical protein
MVKQSQCKKHPSIPRNNEEQMLNDVHVRGKNLRSVLNKGVNILSDFQKKRETGTSPIFYEVFKRGLKSICNFF